MADEYAEKVLYFCDHKKNVNCKKTICVYEGNASTGCACFCTTDPAFALRDQSGNPIVFEKHRSLAFLMVLGFMTGSIISIFPGLPKDVLNWVLSIVAVTVGLGISYLFKVLGKKFNVKE